MTPEIQLGILSPGGGAASLHLHRHPLLIAGDAGTGKTYAARLIATAATDMPRYILDRLGAWTADAPLAGTLTRTMPDGQPQLPDPANEGRLLRYATAPMTGEANGPAETHLHRRIAERCATDGRPRMTVADTHHPQSPGSVDPLLDAPPRTLQAIAVLDTLRQARDRAPRCQVLLFRTRSPDAAAHAATLLGLTGPQRETLRRLDRGHCYHISPDRQEPALIHVGAHLTRRRLT